MGELGFEKKQLFDLRTDLAHSWGRPGDWCSQNRNPSTFFVAPLCMGVDRVDGVDLLITFFFMVRFLISLAHSIRIDETRKMS